MRLKCIASLSLILLVYLAANVGAVKDAGSVSVNPGESLVDKLWELSSNPELYENPSGYPATPDDSKKQWANRTNNLNVPMPTSLSGGGMSAKASRNQAESESADAAEDTTADATTSETTNATASSETELPPAASSASVAGLWSFELNDTTQKYAVITILQNGDELSGEGSLREGNDTLKTAISGSLQADKMNLVITTLGTISQYKLALGLNGDSAIGNYTAFSANGDSWTGSADGLKTS
jgi:hypothetical protein